MLKKNTTPPCLYFSSKYKKTINETTYTLNVREQYWIKISLGEGSEENASQSGSAKPSGFGMLSSAFR